jgi:hypothetical protein
MWGREGLETIKAQIAPGASDVELAVFAETCKRLRLDPFANQIWSIRRRTYNRDTRQYDERQVTQIGVHGLRLIAQRTREWGGRAGPLWLTADGEWVHVWLDDKPPRAARVGVKRRGNAEYTWSVAVWDRAAQVDKDGNPMSLWKTRGPEMLALAAERDALRSEFAAETTDLEVEIDPETARLNAAKYAQIYDPEREQARFDTETARASSRRSYTEIFEADDQARTDAQTRQANAAGRAIADQAHAAAATRDEDLDRLEAERQKRQEGLL